MADAQQLKTAYWEGFAAAISTLATGPAITETSEDGETNEEEGEV